MKRARHRIDVNLNELDQVLDHARAEPLSDSDYEKLRTALHTLAELLSRRRSTEKTSAVVDRPEISNADATTATEADQKQAGHGRNPASAFTGARKGRDRSRATEARRPLPGMPEGESIYAEGTTGSGAHRRAGAAECDGV
jgi:hypothetical protein